MSYNERQTLDLTYNILYEMSVEIDKIYLGDCFELMKNIPDGRINLIVTDPPFGGAGGSGGNEVADGELGGGGNVCYDIERFAREVERLQGDDINAYFFCKKAQVAEYLRVYSLMMGCSFEVLCWHKSNPVSACSTKYTSDTEFCLYFRKGKRQIHPSCPEDAATYFIGEVDPIDMKRWKHPSMKPLDFVRRIIRNSSNESDIVLDPFLGSGTTALAAIRENRHYMGFEVNRDYYTIASKRVTDEVCSPRLMFMI